MSTGHEQRSPRHQNKKSSMQKDEMNLILKTQRLRLKPILESELTLLHQIFINPYVREYLCDGEVFSLQQVKEMLMESQKLFDEKRFGLWFIETQDEQETIGFVGLWYFFEEKQPQLIYALLPHATHKGFATEAATRILEYSFSTLGYSYLLASCDRPNLSSQRVVERIGMKEVEKRFIDGKPILFFKVERS
ncbi:MAG TPA: GNAT family N-acetyltransferase [Coleofasciculaceae cyanobacterium]